MGNPVPKESIPRRQILIIGMLDSVHLARWLGQFVNEEIDFSELKLQYEKYISRKNFMLSTLIHWKD